MALRQPRRVLQFFDASDAHPIFLFPLVPIAKRVIDLSLSLRVGALFEFVRTRPQSYPRVSPNYVSTRLRAHLSRLRLRSTHRFDLGCRICPIFRRKIGRIPRPCDRQRRTSTWTCFDLGRAPGHEREPCHLPLGIVPKSPAISVRAWRRRPRLSLAPLFRCVYVRVLVSTFPLRTVCVVQRGRAELLRDSFSILQTQIDPSRCLCIFETLPVRQIWRLNPPLLPLPRDSPGSVLPPPAPTVASRVTPSLPSRQLLVSIVSALSLSLLEFFVVYYVSLSLLSVQRDKCPLVERALPTLHDTVCYRVLNRLMLAKASSVVEV